MKLREIESPKPLTKYIGDVIFRNLVTEVGFAKCDRTQEKGSFGGFCRICVFGITVTRFQRSITWYK